MRTVKYIIAMIACLSAAGVFFVWSQYRVIETDSSLHSEVFRLRGSFVALVDIIRARDAAIVASRGDQEKPLPEELFEAADYIFVRSETFEKEMGENPSEASKAVLKDLQNVSNGLDEAISQDKKFLKQNLAKLEANEKSALVSLMNLYDYGKQKHVVAIERHESLLRNLVLGAIALLIVFALISSVAVYFWQSEVLTRKKRRQAEERAKKLAFFDQLTGLPNRSSFMDFAETAIAENDNATFFLLDLDEFKQVNDTYGHLAGDTLLKNIASRLQAKFEGVGGKAARFAGDEFAGILPGRNADDDTILFCSELRAMLVKPFEFESNIITPGISIGVADLLSVMPGDCPSVSNVLRNADFALYQAKAGGRRSFRIYDKEMAKSVAETLKIKAMMPEALKKNEFMLNFQPQIDMATGDLHGFEALVRWRHEGAIVPPSSFVPLAEQTGFVTELDHWVFRKALIQAKRWNARSLKPIHISSNLSAQHFKSLDLVERIKETLDKSGFDPQLVTLEITESVLIGDWVKTSKILEGLSKLGVKIALDDFGTGYSSLSYLRRLDVHEIKIDRSFVTDVEKSTKTQIMLDAVVDIAGSLGMQMVVEGIENKSQAEVVRKLGGQIGQGYYFSKPLEESEALKFVTRDLVMAI